MSKLPPALRSLEHRLDRQRAPRRLLLAHVERDAQVAGLHVGAAQVIDHAERGRRRVQRLEPLKLARRKRVA